MLKEKLQKLIDKYKAEQTEFKLLYQEAEGIALTNYKCGNRSNGDVWDDVANGWLLREMNLIKVINDLEQLIK